MQRGRIRRQRWRAWLAVGAAALSVAAATPPPAATPAALPDARPWPRLARTYTLLDPSLALPPMSAMAPDLHFVVRELGDKDAPASTPAVTKAPKAVAWKLGYQHAQLGDLLPSDTLRNDPSTGYTRHLDTDVLALGMSWQLAGNQFGVGYQLQSARGGADAGLGRFLPGSDAATHAFTLGVSRAFGGGIPPPAPPPLLVVEAPPDATPEPALPAD